MEGTQSRGRWVVFVFHLEKQGNNKLGSRAGSRIVHENSGRPKGSAAWSMQCGQRGRMWKWRHPPLPDHLPPPKLQISRAAEQGSQHPPGHQESSAPASTVSHLGRALCSFSSSAALGSGRRHWRDVPQPSQQWNRPEAASVGFFAC